MQIVPLILGDHDCRTTAPKPESMLRGQDDDGPAGEEWETPNLRRRALKRCRTAKWQQHGFNGPAELVTSVEFDESGTKVDAPTDIAEFSDAEEEVALVVNV